MSFREDFERFAKANGMDVLPLHPDDRITESRYYFEESTEQAHSVAAELSLKAEARVEELESSLEWVLQGFKSVLAGKSVRNADEIICHVEKLLGNNK